MYGHGLRKTSPFNKPRGVSLAPRRNVAMPVYPLGLDRGVNLPQSMGKPGKRSILGMLVWKIIRAVQFDSNGKIIYTRTTFAIGLAGVPGTSVKGHELDKLAISTNQNMSGNFQAAHLSIIGILVER